ncbi:MAG: glycosyltransferase family 2 protein [Gemmatimonadota bacterium]
MVVDDGSVDDTWERAARIPVALLRHACNLGQGAALQTGIRYARMQSDVRFVVTFDSDGQHSAADIRRLLAPLESGKYDVVFGSRFAAGGPSTGMPASRRHVLRLAVALTRLTTGLTVTDTHNGLRAFTAEAAGKIVIRQNGMAHASEILGQIASLGCAGARWLSPCDTPSTLCIKDSR